MTGIFVAWSLMSDGSGHDPSVYTGEQFMKTIAVINQKGGCGKTTTAINLSSQLARQGQRVLLVDLDPQSHCAAGLGVPEQRIEIDVSDALLNMTGRSTDPTRLLWKASKNLDLCPSRMKLAGLEANRGGLSELPDKEHRLNQLLALIATGYDYVIIDCPPSIGLLTYNALAAADVVLIPVETGFFAMQGATRQLNTVRTLARRLAKPIAVCMLPTLHDEANTVANDLLNELHTRYKDRVVPVVIRRDSKLREAASFGQAVVDYAPNSIGAHDYGRLAMWLLKQQVMPQEIPAEDVAIGAMQGASHSLDQAVRNQMPSESTQSASSVAVATEPSVATPSEVKPMNRAEDVAKRAQEFLRRVALGKMAKPEESEVASPTKVAEAHTTLRLVNSEQPIAKTATPNPATQRLFGVRETNQGVLFVQPLPVGRAVSIAGDFNGWSPEAHPLVRNDSLGVWELCLKLKPGSYRYRVVIDGIWGADPYNDRSEPNPFGEANSLIVISRQLASVSA